MTSRGKLRVSTTRCRLRPLISHLDLDLTIRATVPGSRAPQVEAAEVPA
jgi:hypothetical protein